MQVFREILDTFHLLRSTLILKHMKNSGQYEEKCKIDPATVANFLETNVKKEYDPDQESPI